MPKLTLSFISAYNERVEPLMNGTIKAEGIDIVPTYSHPSETFWRQLRFNEFDIAEMSMSSYLIARERGADMIALPVFPSRRLFHTEIFYHVDSGITQPADIAGKRFGVAEYQQTAALWQRGILEHDFGVSQYKVHWYMERTEALSHGGATGFSPPAGISFQRIPPEKSLVSMLVRNELDAAAIGSPWRNTANIIGRSDRISGAEGDWGKIKPLFPDRMAEGSRFFNKWGFLPVNHAYIVRGELYRRHPWIAFNLYTAFAKAKDHFNARLLEAVPTAFFFAREYLAQTRRMFGDDPFPYGVKANRKMLETLAAFSHEQGLIREKPAIEELFAESTRDL
ncbi:MAG TPA: PhnD/SsuA/transferrin family substrate-binding protein [Candidatus Eisenbacteria bacterium]|nr:PhnD/SsuA/transferrin family substrate-binding protein [Candidatus Eisenbacteria bacterium]